MEMLQDGIIAMLSAVGLTTLLWMLAGLLTRPRRCREAAYIVVPAGRETKRLAETVRCMLRLNDELRAFRKIIILNQGADKETEQIAKLLLREQEEMILCTEEELTELLHGDSADS